MGNDAVHAHVVPHMAVATRTLGGRVAQVCGVVAVASARLNAEQPLVPGQPLIPQGVPGEGVEVVIGVLGHQIMCPAFLWGFHEFASDNDIPGGLWGVRSGGGKVGSVFGILVRFFLVQLASVALNPLNRPIFGEEGLSGAQDPSGVLDGAFGPCGRGDCTFTVDL